MPQHDIFVSYPRQEQNFVESIVQVLRDRGLNVFFDKDIGVGEDWPSVLEEAIKGSMATVIFVTPSYLKSEWGVLERNAALILRNSGKTHLVIPVLLQGTTPEMLPLLLQSLQYLDFSSYSLSDLEKRKEIGQKLADAVMLQLPGIGLPTLDMPFVVLAMTKQEANDLVEKTLSDQNSDLNFKALLNHLIASSGKDQILSHYGDARDEWRSPLCPPKNGQAVTIRETIEDVVKRLNLAMLKTDEQYEESIGRILRTQYFSADFTSDNEDTRNRTYIELGRRGCVLVVDFLSLFHPKMRACYDDSGLAQPESKIVPIIVPLPQREKDDFDTLLEEAMKKVMLRPFYRYETELNVLCEFGISHPRALRRWLYFVLPLAASAIQRQGATPENRKLFRSKLEVENKP